MKRPINKKLVTKLNKLIDLAHTKNNTLSKQEIIDEVNKNKDFRFKKCMTDAFEYLTEANIRIIDGNDENDLYINTLIKANESDNKISKTQLFEIFEGHGYSTDSQIYNNIVKYLDLNSVEVDDEDEEIAEFDPDMFNEITDEELMSTFETNSPFMKDMFGAYLSYIQKYGEKLLTAEEEIQLAYKIREGDTEAYNRLVLANLKLVISIAKHYVNMGLPLEDLVQEGNIGLMKAAHRFDPDRGFRFSTYSTNWIWQGITRALGNDTRVIRLPVHSGEQARLSKKAETILTMQLGRRPTIQEIVDYLNEHKMFSNNSVNGVTAENIAIGLKFYNLDSVISLQTPISNENGEDDNLLEHFIEDTRTPSTEEIAERNELKAVFDELLSTVLTEKESQIVKYRFGIIDGQPKTLEYVGSIFGVTRERIRQIESKALRKLKRSVKARQLLSSYR